MNYLRSCSCNTSITYTQILFPYVYASFSDVDECRSGSHVCRATKCKNTIGSYECINTPSSSTMSVATARSSSSIKHTVHTISQGYWNILVTSDTKLEHDRTTGQQETSPRTIATSSKTSGTRMFLHFAIT